MRPISRNTLPILALFSSVFIASCGSSGTGTNLTQLKACVATSDNWETWIARESSNDVKIINGIRFQELVMLPMLPTGLTGPYGVAFNSDETIGAIAMRGTAAASYADAGVVLVDIGEGGKTRTVRTGVVTNKSIYSVTARPGSNEVWAVATSDDQIFIIDTTAATVSGMPITVGGSGSPTVVRFSPDGATAFVMNSGVNASNSNVSIIDAAAKTVSGTYTTSKGTHDGQVSEDGKTLWVVSAMDNIVEKIDLLAADKATAVKPLAMAVVGAYSISVAKTHLVVTARDESKIVLLDGDGNKTNEFPVPGAEARPSWVGVSPNCARAYFIDESGTGTFTEVDVNTPKLKGSMPMDGGAHGIAVRTAPPAM